jgi:hypothetical protein
MSYKGIVKDNVVVLEPGVELPDGTTVHVETDATDDIVLPAGKTDLFEMGELAAETGIPDLAANADHYLYGHPKVSNAG